MRSDLCVICGRPAGDHHAFMPPVKPAGCVCDEGSWGERVTPICSAFVANANEPDYCANCEHDEACHGKGECSSG